VVFEQPDGSACSVDGDSRDLVSRVIGLPGQTIWSEDDSIFIDGERLDEPGWHNPPFGAVGTTEIVRTTIPADSYFVLGDNRTDTCDSRAFGPVSESLLVGEVVATTLRNGNPFVHFI
jgi:signal peptidase I